MAAPPTSDDDEFHSLSDHSIVVENDDANLSIMESPVHPVESMQGAFEESIAEAAEEDEYPKSESKESPKNRRIALLTAKEYDSSWTARWKQRPGTTYHPLTKLIAQIVFGMHLLQQSQAKSDEEVVRILQNHVNEVDLFLEHTYEDFDAAIADIEERVAFLKLPMQHMETFVPMLDNRKFRAELLDGNEKIEKIIQRTSLAMDASSEDIKVALDLTRQLSAYLDQVETRWPRDGSDIVDVFGAMRGNEMGWIKFLSDLEIKGGKLGHSLIVLTSLLDEISRLAAAASRRTRMHHDNMSKTVAAHGRSSSSPMLQSKYANPSPQRGKPDPLLDKPLPRAPASNHIATAPVMPKAHPVPFETRYEQPRQLPPTPMNGTTKSLPAASPVIAAQNDQGGNQMSQGTREARVRPVNGTRALADFLKTSGPSRSSPSIAALNGPAEQPSEKKPYRSPSSAAKNFMHSLTHRRVSLMKKRTTNLGEPTIPGPNPESENISTSNSVAVDQRKEESTMQAQDFATTTPHAKLSTSNGQQLNDVEMPSQQVDSAYSSGTRTEHTNSDASASKQQQQQQPQPQSETASEAAHHSPATDPRMLNTGDRPAERSTSRATSTRLSLFPRDLGYTTPSQAAAQQKDRRLQTDSGGASAAPAPPISDSRPQGQGHLRTGSIRRFFQRKDDGLVR